MGISIYYKYIAHVNFVNADIHKFETYKKNIKCQ